MLDAFIIQKIREEEQRRREAERRRPSLEESWPQEDRPDQEREGPGDSSGERGVLIIERDEE